MITVKFDNTLEFEKIKVPMMTEGSENGSESTGSESNIKQTKVIGVMIPLIMVNTYIVFPDDVISLELTIEDHLPTLRCDIRDSMNLVRALNAPGPDNTMQLQILPPFDEAYKKIQLQFYITHSVINGDVITINGIYNIDKFWDCTMKSYGMTSTYDLFEQVAHELKLGFASNISGTNDERYIYNPNLNYHEFLNQEEKFAGNKDTIGGEVYEWWIDYWNNINLVNVISEYNSHGELPKIWSPVLKWKDPTESENDDKKPVKIRPEISNLGVMTSTPLYADSYESINSPAAYTDVNSEVFSMLELDRYSTLIQDGDIKNSVFTKYAYDGELFGDYDYLTQRRCRHLFTSKLESQMIRTTVQDAVFSLPKGFKVDLIWYEYQSHLAKMMSEKDIKTNIPTPPADKAAPGMDNDDPTLNKQVTGQYYINNMSIEYYSKGWHTIYELARPAAGIEKYDFSNEQGEQTEQNSNAQ